jgi:dihydroorotate dehydrogenase electron transfer subunit
MGTPEIRIFEIESNREIARDTWEMILAGDASGLDVPGRFVNIAVDGCYLRRPLSVCCRNGDRIALIYKIVGKGTGLLSQMEPGARLDLLAPLGNGFDTSAAAEGDRIVLVGGGAGLPPLYGLCQKLLEEGKTPTVVMGFGTASEVFYEEEMRRLGVPVAVTTLDGSRGLEGTVLAAVGGPDGRDSGGNPLWDIVFACGPEPMLRGISGIAPRGQFSFESRMGCGFGACMGCSCKTLTGDKRICKDGPVFRKEEILWQTQA